MKFNIRLIYNVIFWIVILGLEMTMFITANKIPFSSALWMVFIRVPSELFIYFTAIYFLFPQLFIKKYFQFFIYLIAVMVITVFIFRISHFYFGLEKPLSNSFWEEWKKEPPSYLEFFYYLRNPTIALALYYLPKYIEIENKKKEAEKLKVIAEMNLLKTQIQPHFLFNSLNNLYSLTLANSKLASEYVLKLSEIMEYLLYKANKDFIPIKLEIDHITNYVELEKLKYGDRLHISWDIDKETLKTEIAPLLLFTFIENAFKHGTSKDVNNTFISISLKKVTDKLVYTVVNSLPIELKTKKNLIGGKGIAILESRLKLSYENKYKLSFNTNENTFMAVMELEQN